MLYLRNLGIVITDLQESGKINKLATKVSSPIRYFEKSRLIFRPVVELDLLEKIRKSTEENLLRIQELEDLMRSKHTQNNDRLTWGLNAVGINETDLDGRDIDICILDTGFYKNHPDFAGRDISGKSFVPNQSWEEDKHGHGTHCTGIAAGAKSLENGIKYGIASGARIAIGKVLDDEGNGATDWVLNALDYCIEKRYKVISMSLGASAGIGEAPNPLFENAGKIALQNNCLLIAAAGNESNRPGLPRPVNIPANCESFMAVAALERSLKVAHFSNAGINVSNGGKIDLSAPGVGVYSSYSPNALGNKLYATLDGTSMATPHVSGLAALYYQAFPNSSASEIWIKLEKKARQLNNQQIRDVGNGLVQAI